MVYYEWSLEYIDKRGDIIDIDFADKVADFGMSVLSARLCLVRNAGNEIDGLQDRQWAYVKDGQLPVHFEDSAANETTVKVPKRFQEELKLFNIY
jgi:hypothetical protein